MNVIWSPRARRNLDEIFTYILDENPSAAVRVIEAIESRVADLARYPDLGRPGSVANTRELVITSTPYVVAYRLRDRPRRIEIIAVIHGARLWPEWFE